MDFYVDYLDHIDITQCKNTSDYNPSNPQRVLYDFSNSRFLNVPTKNPPYTNRYYLLHEKETEADLIFNDYGIRFQILESKKITNKNKENEQYIFDAISNPFSQIDIQLIRRRIKINKDKITFSYFSFSRHKEINSKILSTPDKLEKSITINTKTGDFFLIGAGKKIVKNVFSIEFFSLIESILTLREILLINKEQISESNIKYLEKVKELLTLYNHKFTSDDITSELKKFFIDTFIKCKSIKTPNNYRELIFLNYPTKAILKKNDNKLIQSILDFHGLKSKFLIKKFHQNSFLDISNILKIKQLLGDDFNKFLSSLCEDFYINNISIKNKFHILSNKKNITLSPVNKKEKENIIKIINNFFDIPKEKINTLNSPIISASVKEEVHKLSFINNIEDIKTLDKEEAITSNILITDVITLIFDTFVMFDILDEYIPNLELNATTIIDLKEQHDLLVKEVNKLKNPIITELIYDANIIRGIEKSVIFDDIEYEFVLLKNSDDYEDEGRKMNHCVATYINNTNSVIVSIRQKNSKNAVTCEFNKKTGSMVQARTYSNNEPPENFKNPLDVLKKRMEMFGKQRKLDPIGTKKTVRKINGKDVPQKNPMNFLPF